MRKFSGFAAGVEKTKDIIKTKLLENKKRYTVSLLKDCAEVVGLEKSGSREDLVLRLVEYFAAPKKLKGETKTEVKKRKAEKVAKAKANKKVRREKGIAAKKNKIKKPMSSYMLFNKEQYTKVKAENPDMPLTEITKLVGAKWKEMSDGDKAPYVKEAEELKAKFNKENPGVMKGGASKSRSPKKAKKVGAGSFGIVDSSDSDDDSNDDESDNSVNDSDEEEELFAPNEEPEIKAAPVQEEAVSESALSSSSAPIAATATEESE